MSKPILSNNSKLFGQNRCTKSLKDLRLGRQSIERLSVVLNLGFQNPGFELMIIFDDLQRCEGGTVDRGYLPIVSNFSKMFQGFVEIVYRPKNIRFVFYRVTNCLTCFITGCLKLKLIRYLLIQNQNVKTYISQTNSLFRSSRISFWPRSRSRHN